MTSATMVQGFAELAGIKPSVSSSNKPQLGFSKNAAGKLKVHFKLIYIVQITVGLLQASNR